MLPPVTYKPPSQQVIANQDRNSNRDTDRPPLLDDGVHTRRDRRSIQPVASSSPNSAGRRRSLQSPGQFLMPAGVHRDLVQGFPMPDQISFGQLNNAESDSWKRGARFPSPVREAQPEWASAGHMEKSPVPQVMPDPLQQSTTLSGSYAWESPPVPPKDDQVELSHHRRSVHRREPAIMPQEGRARRVQPRRSSNPTSNAGMPLTGLTDDRSFVPQFDGFGRTVNYNDRTTYR